MEKHSKRVARISRHKRVRKKMLGTPERPRMSVFRSARHIYVQVVDDINAVTIASASTLSKEFREKVPEGGKREAAKRVGQLIAEKVREKGLEQIVFDRGGYKFHGRVKALAEGAKELGCKF